MATKITRRNTIYGFPNPQTGLQQEPIVPVPARSPGIYDQAEVGTIWVNTATSLAYILVNTTAGISTWLQIESSGGAGVFSSLLVNPGPFTTQGTGAVNISADAVNTTVNVGTGAGAKLVSIGSITGASSLHLLTGTGNFSLNGVGASTYTIGASTTSGTITIGGTAQTGTIALGQGTGIQTIDLGTGGTGAKTVNLGSTASSSTTTLQAGTGGLALDASGLVSVAPALGTSATATITVNERVIQATYTGFTTASGSFQNFTIASSLILTTSAILVSVANLNASTNAAFMGIEGIEQATGSIVVRTLNNGAGALGAGDNVIITVWILS